MLNAIRQIALRVRLEVAFVKHEWVVHRTHITEADSKFDTAPLELEIQKAKAAIRTEVETEFGPRLSTVIAEENAATSTLRGAEEKLRLFQRDFKSELAPLYDELNRIKEILSEAYNDKSAAYSHLSSAKSSLNSWYAKSDRTFLGNRGRQLPKHAIFGQDLSDRDYYKRQRDSAADDVGRVKSEIARLKNQKASVGEQIGSIKRGRDRMFELKDGGLNRKIASENAGEALKAATEAHLVRQREEQARVSFEADSAKKHGLHQLLARLDEMKAGRIEFVRSFEAPGEKAKRRQEFERLFSARFSQ